jgi:peptidoglycan/LPS O-acetylase OafA/YrhL
VLPSAGHHQRRLYFAVLESLRGWAILFVVLFHLKGILYGDIALATADSWLWTAAYVGNTGVTLFFVLSGFLLSLPFFAGAASCERPSIASFYAARALRILPLYWLAVLVAWIDMHDAASCLRALIFVPVGFAIYPHGLPWWSLSTEVQFYLLLPLAMVLWRDRRGRWLVFAALLAWLALYVRFYRLHWWVEAIEYTEWRDSLFGRAPNFLAGIAAAYLFSSEVTGRAVRRSSGVLAIACAGILAWMLHLVAVAGPDASVDWPHWHVAEGMLWAALVLAALHSSSRVAALWDNAVMRMLGRISYGVFLFHLPILSYALGEWSRRADKSVAPVWDPVLVGRVTAGVVGCVLVGTALHYAVEAPCQRLRRRLAR